MEAILKMVTEHIDMFSNVAGIKIKYIDKDDCNLNGCNFCASFNLSCNCNKLLHHSAKLSSSLYDGYSFFCERGFTLFCAPVMDCDKYLGGYFSQPLIMDELSTYLDELVEKFPNINQNSALSFLKELPNVTAKRLRHLTGLLYILSNEFKHDSQFAVHEKRERLKAQSQLNEEIQQLKKQFPDGFNSLSTTLENKLTDCIKTGDTQASRRILNELLGEIFFLSGANLELIKLKALELTVLISRTSAKAMSNIEILGFNKNSFSKIMSLSSYYELCEWMDMSLKQYFSMLENGSPLNYSINIACDYIIKNCEKNLTLTEVAEQVFLSPSYFSRVFKAQTGENFVDYLNKTKIDKSMTLLLNLQLSLVDIAAQLGFADQSYFSKVFKKVCGTTPLAFRKNIQT